MNKQRFLALSALAGMAAVSGSANAAFDLGNCDGLGNATSACPYVTYGEGNSYSLMLNVTI